MMYFKSTATGQIYKCNFIPMGEGWELVRKEDYDAQPDYCKNPEDAPKK